MKIIHVYPGPFEAYYPKYQDKQIESDLFDKEIVCNTDLEVRYLAGMQEMGDKCILLYPRCFGLKEKSFKHRNGYEVRRFPITFFENVPGRIRGALCLGMLRYIWKERPDIVHYNHIYAGGYFPINMLLLIALLCRFLKIPIVGWYHVGKLTGKRGKVPFIRQFYRQVRIFTLKQLSGITSINHNELERLFNPDSPEYYGVDLDNMPHRQAVNTFDRRLFTKCSREEAATQTGLNPSNRYLLFVSRLFLEKGLHYLVHCIPRLIVNYPDLHLIIIGDFIEGTETFQQELFQFIEKNNLAERIIFLGRVEHHQGLKYYYNIAEVFVLPTYVDSFAAVNIEALACGTPVVSTDREEIPYYLKPGLGIVIPQQNEEKLFGAIDDILSGRFQFDEKQCEEVLSQYDYRPAAAALREWYMEIIRQKKP